MTVSSYLVRTESPNTKRLCSVPKLRTTNRIKQNRTTVPIRTSTEIRFGTVIHALNLLIS